MSDFVVSARKYRPQTFDTVVGQKAITNTLKNAIKNQHLAQAFLFCGSRGVGKTTTARILAKTINCFNRTESVEACDKCDSCLSFNEGASLNVYELDAASNNSVDDIRGLIDQVRIAPQLGTHKVYIIDEVHMLSTAAFNAFLKTLEEPPAHAIFILATTEKHKILPTILSRCQIFDFQRIKVKDIADHLAHVATQEAISADPDALHLIAQKADGALRDALSIFDQIVSFCGTTITHKAVLENLNVLDHDYYFKIVENALNEDIPACLLLFNDVMEKGFDGHQFLVGLAEHFRNLLICKDPRTANLLEVGETTEKLFVDQAKKVDGGFSLRCLGVLSKADVDYKSAKNQRLLVELTLMQICSVKSELEKKKSLTDPVQIIAFPGQSLRNEPKPVNKPSVTPERVTFATKPEAKVLSAPTGNLNSNNLSINQLIEQQKAKAQVPQSDLPKKEFHKDDVIRLWKTMAHTQKLNGQDQVYHVMIKREPVQLDDTTFQFEVDNTIQLTRLEGAIGDVMAYIRKEIQNYDLVIQLEMIKDAPEEVKYLNGPDRFDKLAKKNSNLFDLKNRFNLDIDY